ncbi:MAG: AmmeMemoRadiSam system protein A, partial [Selenomonadaceae bacterium]|nr:AmmeMemoRadiSam system protein A [Selenomonadaceae bacterium]
MSILGAVAVPHPPIILPEVGHGEELKISATTNAYKEISRRIVELEPETIVITSPHSVMYADYFHISPGPQASGDMSQFRAGQVALTVNYDVELAKKISDVASSAGVPAGTLGERNSSLDHGTMIPLRFLQQAGLDFNRTKFLRIGLSGLNAALHYKFGQSIKRATAEVGRRIFFIASGDLSHKLKSDGPYGFVKEGPVFDAQVMENLGGADFFKLLTMDEKICSRAAECGL